MTRLFKIVALSCVGFLLTGCNTPEKDDTLWQNVKMSDLAPSQKTKHLHGQPIKTVSFDVHIFEIPDANVSELDDVWQMLYSKPLRFNDYGAFVANSFSVGFGEIQMWDKIGNLLYVAGGKKVKTTSLLLINGQVNDVTVVRFRKEQAIFYISTDGSMEGATVGPGRLVLRIKTEKIPGSRGVCTVDTIPVFSPRRSSSIPQIAARAKYRRFFFVPAAFRLKMSPGDFILLGPKKYLSDQATLGSLFFSNPEGSLFFSKSEHKPPERKPSVRIFLLVCTGIRD